MSLYRDSFPGRREDQPRIYVKFRPDGADSSYWALLDTGAHFCLLNETVADVIRDHLTESLGSFAVQTPYGRVHGELYLHRIKLIAEVGMSLDIDVTLFTPPEWQGPCFLGYAGAMDRVHFAVNPLANQLRFGIP